MNFIMKTILKKICFYGFIFNILIERSNGYLPESGLGKVLDVPEDAFRSLYLQQCAILPLRENICAVSLESFCDFADLNELSLGFSRNSTWQWIKVCWCL